MGWSGGVFTRTHNWVEDKNEGTNPQASRFDAEDDNFESGINACLTKDGSNAATADLDIGGFKLTNVADPVSTDDAATKSYVDGLSGGWEIGDVRSTTRTTAASGWVLCSTANQTIGSASSGATNRANADTEDLFTHLWDTYADAICAVGGGRGASAAADWAANKTITVPDFRGRVFGVVGTGSGLTARTNGATAGTETHPLIEAELAQHNHGATGLTATPSLTGPAHVHSLYVAGTSGVVNGIDYTGVDSVFPTGYSSTGANYTTVSGGGGAVTGTISMGGSTANTGSGTAHQNMQPTFFLHCEIKL